MKKLQRKSTDALGIKIQKAFGCKLRTIRKKKEMSQEELAHEIGWEKSHISKVENHGQNVSLVTIFLIARALEANPCDLIDLSIDARDDEWNNIMCK